MVLSITNLQNKIYQHSFPIAPVFLTFLLHRYQRATKQAKAFSKSQLSNRFCCRQRLSADLLTIFQKNYTSNLLSLFQRRFDLFGTLDANLHLLRFFLADNSFRHRLSLRNHLIFSPRTTLIGSSAPSVSSPS